MFQNMKEKFYLVKRSRKHILLFELSYKLIAVAVILPLVFFLVNTGMKFAGISYLTNEYIYKTVTSPYVITAMLIIMTAVVLYCIYEMSFILSSYEYLRRKEDVSFYVTVYGAFHKMKDCLRVINIPFIFYYIIAILAVNVTIVCNIVFTHTTRDLFRIHVINGEWYIKAALAAGFILMYVIVFLGIYSFHIFFLEDKSFKEAFLQSSRMVMRHPRRTIFSIIGYNLIVLVVLGIFYCLISVILVVGVKLLDMAYMGSAVYLSVLRYVRFAVKAILCCLAIPVSFLVVTGNYYRFTDKKNIDFPLIYLKEKNIHFHRLVYCGVVLCSVISVILNVVRGFNNNPFERIAIFHETQITAHRGVSSEAPENTMSAFQKAMEQLADCIELDVQMTSDGELVVIHDDTALRTTGVNRRISDMTLEEVKKLDAGSWFSKEYAGEKIPTLREVMELSDGKIKINIEIKANSNSRAIAEKVADLIREYDAENWCVVTSFDYNSLRIVKEFNKDVRVGYILSVAYGSFYEMNDMDFFSVNASFLTKRTVDAIHNSGKEVYAWTVNNEDAIRNLSNKGVDNIITDYPILAAETVYSRDTSETIRNMLKYVFNQ